MHREGDNRFDENRLAIPSTNDAATRDRLAKIADAKIKGELQGKSAAVQSQNEAIRYMTSVVFDMSTAWDAEFSKPNPEDPFKGLTKGPHQPLERFDMDARLNVCIREANEAFWPQFGSLVFASSTSFAVTYIPMHPGEGLRAATAEELAAIRDGTFKIPNPRDDLMQDARTYAKQASVIRNWFRHLDHKEQLQTNEEYKARAIECFDHRVSMAGYRNPNSTMMWRIEWAVGFTEPDDLEIIQDHIMALLKKHAN